MVYQIFLDKTVMEGRQFSFSWANHSQFAPNAFRELFGVEAFSDVTLACADDQQLNAHRIILSSCSIFFRNILLKNPQKNTVIYLKGISSPEMQAILKFIYQGSCEVGVDDVKRFLEAGKELKIEGLQDNVDQGAMNESSCPSEDTQYDSAEDSIHSELFYSERPAVEENNIDQPKSILKLESQEIATTFVKHGTVQIFSDAEDEKCLNIKGKYSESEPFVGIKCNECSYKAPDYLLLNKHKEEMHENKVSVISDVIKCMECDFTALNNPNLKQHDQKCSKNILKETNEQTIKKRYNCDRCDYQANFATNFKKHWENTHNKPYKIFKWNKTEMLANKKCL